MSEADRAKWDARYAAGSYAEREHPTALIEAWASELPPGAALDVACGAGRNSLFLAAAGRTVDAVDISSVGLERAREAAAARGLTRIRFIRADLEASPGARLPAGPYAVIVLVRYVDRDLLGHLLPRLERGGLLLAEQHLESSEDVVGPRSPAFRLRSNELLRDALAAGGDDDYSVLYYREGMVTDPDARRAALAQLVLRRR